MILLKKYSVQIDKINDGVQFNIFIIFIFNEGAYSKDLLRNVTRNRGVNIQITNNLNTSIDILKLEFIIEKSTDILTFQSSSLIDKLPSKVSSGGKFEIFVYAYDIEHLLKKHVGERCRISIDALVNGIPQTFHSDLFTGQIIEETIKELNNDDMANWGQPFYVKFDLCGE